MRRGTAVAIGFVLVAGSVMVATGWAADKPAAAMSEKEKAQKEPFPNDAGPDSIDVSKYPPEIQKKYELFKQCSQCHSLARPINSEKYKSDEWSRYVKRMMAKPGCNIKAGTGKPIFEFLTYDSGQRKSKDAASKAAWKAHRLELLTKFKTDHPDRYTTLFENRTPQAEANKELPGW